MIVHELTATQLKYTPGIEKEARSSCTAIKVEALQAGSPLSSHLYENQGFIPCFDNTSQAMVVFANFKPETQCWLNGTNNIKVIGREDN